MHVLPNTQADSELITLLKGGAVGVMPTDTVYGLACSAADRGATARLYELKNRTDKPGTVIAASVDQLAALGIPRRYLVAVQQFWPNPLSVVVPCGDELQYLHLGKHSLAVRIPKDDRLIEMLRRTGPLLTTSANLPGEAPAMNLGEAQAHFGDRVDFYVDAGPAANLSPSTIIRVVDDAIEVLREGALKLNENGKIDA